jgi:hypothetical protein
MRGQAFLAAAAVAVAFMGVPPAVAQNYPTYHDAHVANQQYCQRQRNDRTAGGAVIGALIGGLLGREVADRGVRGEGTALGAVVGAVAGGAIGRNSGQCADVAQGAYDPYSGQAYNQYPPDDEYYDEDLEGGPYDDGYYRGDDYDRDCRMGEVITRDPYGREYREETMLCRGPDGRWRPQ